MGRHSENKHKRLSRKQLLLIVYEQEKELAELKAKLAEANAAPQEKLMNYTSCGSIAEASLEVSGILEAAQVAADTYLKNVMLRHPAFSEDKNDLVFSPVE